MRRWCEGVSACDIAEYENLRLRFEPQYRVAIPRDDLSSVNRDFARYRLYTRALFNAIAAESGALIVVDSSKNAARAANLCGFTDLNVVLLHLIRDPRGVASSLVHPHARAPREGVQRMILGRSVVRTAIAWMLTNLLVNRLCRARRERSILVRYEDYVTQPQRVFQQVGALLGLDLADVVRCAASAAPLGAARHMVAGNRMRMQVRPDIAPQARSGGDLRAFPYLVVSLLTLPLLLRFGYPFKGLALVNRGRTPS